MGDYINKDKNEKKSTKNFVVILAPYLASVLMAVGMVLITVGIVFGDGGFLIGCLSLFLAILIITKRGSKNSPDMATSKNEKQKNNKAICIVAIVSSIIPIIFGLFSLIFDGYCAGGSFCRRMPGLWAFGGGLSVGLSIQIVIYSVKKIMRTPIYKIDHAWTIIVAVVAYLIALGTYFL